MRNANLRPKADLLSNTGDRQRETAVYASSPQGGSATAQIQRVSDAGKGLLSSCHTTTLPTPGGLNSIDTTGSLLSVPPCHHTLCTAGLPSPQPCRWTQAPIFTDLLPHCWPCLVTVTIQTSPFLQPHQHQTILSTVPA